MTFLSYSPYIALFIGILSLWIPIKTAIKPWKLSLFIALILAFWHYDANWIGIAAILSFYFLVEKYQHTFSPWKHLLWGLIFLLGLTLELHEIPGFRNLLVLDNIQFTPDAIPFSLSFKLDKISVGLILIGTTLQLASTPKDWKNLSLKVIKRLPLVIGLLVFLSIVFGYVRWEPKNPQYLCLWMGSNLFFTCLAEEAFFRGFFQESLSKGKYKYASIIAVVLPSFFFGMIDYPGGFHYVFLATVAGILYGWVYHVTKRIEASMITHFLLNLMHLLFFTYPALSHLNG